MSRRPGASKRRVLVAVVVALAGFGACSNESGDDEIHTVVDTPVSASATPAQDREKAEASAVAKRAKAEQEASAKASASASASAKAEADRVAAEQAAAAQAEADRVAAEQAAAAQAEADRVAAEQAAAAQPAPQPLVSTYYGSCADARAAGAAPLYQGDPGYSRKLDRDGDGIACEK